MPKITKITEAIDAVKNGPEKKGLKVQGHHWNFKKAKREHFKRLEGTGVVKGRISHAVRFVDDDQIDYEITYQGLTAGGKLKDPLVEIKIKKGKWSMVSSKIVAAVVGLITKNEKVALTTDAVAKEVFNRIHGKWEAVAKGLVAVIATEFGKDLYSPRMLARARVRATRVRGVRIQPQL